MERLRDALRAGDAGSALLDDAAAKVISAFLNEYFSEGLLEWAMAHTEVGEMAKRKNAWSRGSWTPIAAELAGALKVRAVDSSPQRCVVTLPLRVLVRERGKEVESELTADVTLPEAAYETVDELRTALLRLHEACNDPAGSGVLLRLPGASDDWSLPDDLWLNSTPYRRSVRQMFYQDVLSAMQRAVADPSCSKRMRVVVTPPELNSARGPARGRFRCHRHRACAEKRRSCPAWRHRVTLFLRLTCS